MSQDLEKISPAQALKLYLKHRKPEISDSTYRAHRTRLGHWVRWCEQEEIKNLNSITGRDLLRYKVWRRDEGGLNRVSVRTQMSTLRCFVRFCVKVDAMSDGLAKAVDVPELDRGENARDVMISEERISEILKHLRRYSYASRRHLLVRLLWVTACRLGGARGIDIGDVDLDKQTIDFNHRGEKNTPLKNKSSGERVVAIDNRTAQIIEDWLSDIRPNVSDKHGRDALLATEHGRIGTTTIRRNIYRVTTPQFLDRNCTCDINEHDASNIGSCNESVSPHALRRGAITAMLRRGNDKSLVSGKCDVSPKVVDAHYNEMTKDEKMEQRRDEMDWI